MRELSGATAPGLAKAILSGFLNNKDELREAHTVWRMGKTLKVETILTLGDLPAEPLTYHLTVEGAASSNREALMQDVMTCLERGRFDYSDTALALKPVGGHDIQDLHLLTTPAGTIGIGRLEGQELFISLGRQSPQMSFRDERGQNIVPEYENLRDSVIFELQNGHLYLIGTFTRMTPKQVRSLNRPLEVTLQKISNGLLMLGLKMPEISGHWLSIFFSMGVIKDPASRRLHSLHTSGRLPLNMVIGRSETGEILFERRLLLSETVSNLLRDLLEEQAAGAQMSQEDYAQAIMRYELERPDNNARHQGNDVIRCMTGRSD